MRTRRQRDVLRQQGIYSRIRKNVTDSESDSGTPNIESDSAELNRSRKRNLFSSSDSEDEIIPEVSTKSSQKSTKSKISIISDTESTTNSDEDKSGFEIDMASEKYSNARKRKRQQKRREREKVNNLSVLNELFTTDSEEESRNKPLTTSQKLKKHFDVSQSPDRINVISSSSPESSNLENFDSELESDFIDDEDQNENHQSALSAAVAELRGSRELYVEDFQAIVDLFIKDLTHRNGPHVYLEKIHRPHHYDKHIAEITAFNNFSDRLQTAAKFVKTAAWNSKAEQILSNYPKLRNFTAKSPLAKRIKKDHVKRCFVCNRFSKKKINGAFINVSPKLKIELHGRPYDRKSFRDKEILDIESASDDSVNSDQEIYGEVDGKVNLSIGECCFVRIEYFHQFHHYLHTLYFELKKICEKEVITSIESQTERRKAVMDIVTEKFINRRFERIKRDLEESENIEQTLKDMYRNTFGR